MHKTGVDELKAVIMPAADVQCDGCCDPAVEDELSVVLDHRGCGVEGLSASGCLHNNISSDSACELLDRSNDILLLGVQYNICAELLCKIQLSLKRINNHYLVCSFELCALCDDLACKASAHDNNSVTELYSAVHAAEHSACNGLSQSCKVLVQSLWRRLELEALCLEVVCVVVVPAE